MMRARILLLPAVVLLPLRANAATYYVAPGGRDTSPGTLAQPWRTIQHAADTLAPGDTVLIRAGTYHERVIVTRSGAAGAPLTFAVFAGETAALDGTGVTMPDALAGLFEVSLASYVTVRGLRVQNVGPYTLNSGFLVESSQHVVLQGNVTDGTLSSGIGVWHGQDVTLDGNEVIHACNGGIEEEISVDDTTGFAVVNNRVHDAGVPNAAGGGEGICLKDGSNGGRVHGNSIWNVPRKVGIYIDAWDKHTWDIEVEGNLVHDCADGIAVGSEMGGLLENVRVTNNVAYSNTYRGVTVSDWGASATHPMQNLLVANNTLVGNGTGPTPWGGGITVDNLQVTGVVLRNNIASANASFEIVVSPGVPLAQVAVDHNLVYPFLSYPGETRGTQYVEADPAFVGTGGHDYHLSSVSPAIDAGSAVAAPAADFDGVPRPQGTGFDIGAFENAPTRFYTVTPCRVADTRNAAGPSGGPALAANSSRTFPVAGICGIPPSALAVAVNVTVADEADAGHLRLYPAGRPMPLVSAINFTPGKTRANNAVVPLGTGGQISVYCGMPPASTGETHLILDVTGYFQ